MHAAVKNSEVSKDAPSWDTSKNINFRVRVIANIRNGRDGWNFVHLVSLESFSKMRNVIFSRISKFCLACKIFEKHCTILEI